MRGSYQHTGNLLGLFCSSISFYSSASSENYRIVRIRVVDPNTLNLDPDPDFLAQFGFGSRVMLSILKKKNFSSQKIFFLLEEKNGTRRTLVPAPGKKFRLRRHL